MLEGSLDIDRIYINILIISITSIRALCDFGCQCFATMSEQFVKERGLDASSIQPRPLEQVMTTKNRLIIRQIVVFIADIDGIEEKIVAYVIPGHIDNIILGKGWMERHDVSIRPAKGQVCIQKPFKIIVKSRAITLESIEEIRAKTIQALQASNEVVQIFSVSLANIQKALTQKENRDPA